MRKALDPMGSRPKSAPQPIVSMSLQLGIPRWVALQQSPPPLPQLDTILYPGKLFNQWFSLNGDVCPLLLSHLKGSPHPSVTSVTSVVNSTSSIHHRGMERKALPKIECQVSFHPGQTEFNRRPWKPKFSSPRSAATSDLLSRPEPPSAAQSAPKKRL